MDHGSIKSRFSEIRIKTTTQHVGMTADFAGFKNLLDWTSRIKDRKNICRKANAQTIGELLERIE
jgi:hypothetical protein